MARWEAALVVDELSGTRAAARTASVLPSTAAATVSIKTRVCWQ